MKLLAATDANLEAHGESNAHLYYATKTRTWDGWSDSNVRGWAVSDTKVDTWEAGQFSTKFTIDLDSSTLK